MTLGGNMHFLYANAVTIICLFLAGSLMWADKNGWGWFLLLAAMCAAVPTSHKCKCECSDSDEAS